MEIHLEKKINKGILMLSVIYNVLFSNSHIMFCPDCETEVERSFNFCPKCGFKLSGLTEKKDQGRFPSNALKIY